MQRLALAKPAAAWAAPHCSCRSRPAQRSCFTSRHLRVQRRRPALAPRAGLEFDWSDPDTLVGVAGAVLGLAVGIGAPLFYISRDERDDKRLEELRELNRQTYKETGEYLSDVRVAPLYSVKVSHALSWTGALVSSVHVCRLHAAQ